MKSDSGRAPPDPSPRRVVGIGASAGGLEAYTRLLKALPAETGLALLVIPHLSPAHPSQLSELLARGTRLRVTEARDGDKMQPDHVYVLPSDRVMRLADGRLHLDPRPTRDGPPSIIDDCLVSLAEAWGPRSVGVILSGTGSDGSAGLQAIKAHGGTTYAQELASAAYDNMPRSAVETGAVDYTMSPEAIARSLTELSRSFPTESPAQAEPESGQPRSGEEPAEAPEPHLSEADAAALDTILGMLQHATGVDFRHYKRPAMTRRVARRVAALGLPDLPSYAKVLQEDSGELELLFSSVLIHVTDFFREPGMYQVLQSTVIPALLAHRPAGTPLRVWVVGCATGEEAYSTAIIFSEVEASLKREVPVKIFASDLSESAIDTARLGRYPAEISAHVSPERLERHFVPVDGGFQVVPRLREMCVFARQDITRDPPFAQIDLILCRNLLIYLEPELQRRVLRVLHYALKPGGFLTLGSAESVAGLGELFSPLDGKHKVYLRRTVPSHMEPNLAWSGQRRLRDTLLVRSPDSAPVPWTSAELQRAAAQALFTHYPSASVIINADLEVRHFQGATSLYLEAPPGGPTVHLLRLAHPDLRLVLGRLIRKAQKEGREVCRRDVRVQAGSRSHQVTVTVLPVPTDETERDHFLVVFESARSESRGRSGPGTGSAAEEPPAGDTRTLELEQELVDVKEYLQAVIDQQDEAHAELQAALESSQSANEEFQSSNEELESTKEELQSVNEELTTVNEQMQQRNAELSARTAEVTGLLEAMDFPILLLTPALRIQAFNATAAAHLRLTRTAIGRTITEDQLPLPPHQLRELVDRALGGQSVQERQMQDRDGTWVALRIWPVVPAPGTATAVVAALVDIGQLKRDVDQANEALTFSEAIIETVREPLVVLDSDLRIISGNRAFAAATGVGTGDCAGVALGAVGTGQWSIPGLHARLAEVFQTGAPFEDYDVEIAAGRTGPRTFRLNARRISQVGERRGNILLFMEDVTARQALERQVIEAGRMQAVGQLAGGVAHEINNQMMAVLGFVKFLSQSDSLTASERSDLGRISTAATRAADVTTQLLAFSRRQPHTQSAIDLNAMVAVAESLLQRILGPGSNIEIEIRLGEAVGAVRLDQAQFEQILVNLALNARDAMTDGGRLTLETASVVVSDSHGSGSSGVHVPFGRYARLTVSDTGVGMDGPTRDRVFEPFFTTKPAGRGTGLGLAAVYGTVKQSGGFIWVESEVGRGTTFTIDLPHTEADPVEMVPLGPTLAPRGTETIVVAEDEEPVRNWIARFLRQQGYNVLEAGDGVEALRLVEREGSTVALIVSDVMMPGMGGVPLRDRLASIRPGLPILLISAYTVEELRVRGIVDRAALVLQKPFEIEAIASRIRSILDSATPSKPGTAHDSDPSA